MNAWFAHTYLSGFELEYLSEFVTYFSMNKQILKQFARICVYLLIVRNVHVFVMFGTLGSVAKLLISS